MTKHKKILATLLALSILSILIGLIISFPVEAGLCPQPKNWQDISCVKKFPVFSVGQPMSYVPILPIVIFIILFFVPELFFNAWKWFALIFGIIGIPLIIATPVFGSGIVSFDKSYVALTMSILFFSISLGIILYQAVKYRQGKGLKK